MSTNNDRKWNPICGDGWGVREAMVIINVYFNDRNTFFQLLLDYENLRYLFLFQVVCRELGLHYAQAGTQTDMFNPTLSSKESTSKIDMV